MADDSFLGRTGGWLREQAAKLKQIPGVGDMADRVSGYAGGAKAALRGAPTTIGDTIAGAAKDSGLSEAQVQHPQVRNSLPGINQTVSQVQGETAAMGPQAAPQVQANPASLRTPNTGANPNIAPGGQSPEAAAYDTAKQVKTGAEAVAKGAEGARPGVMSQVGDAMKKQFGAGSGGLRGAAASAGKAGLGMLGWAAKKVGPAEQIYNASDAASRATSEGLTGDERLNEAKRGGINMLATSIGRFGGGVLGAGAGALTGPAAPAMIPAGAIGGQAVGADLGRRAGEWVTDKMYGQKKGVGVADRVGQMMNEGQAQASNLRTSNVQPDQVQSGSFGAPPEAPQAKQVTTTSGPQSPSQILARDQNSGVPERGTGAFRTGNGPAQAVGSKALSFDPGDGFARRSGGMDGLRKIASTGPAGALAALGGYGAASRMKEKGAEVGLRSAALNNTQRQQNYNMLKDQRDYATKLAEDQRDYAAKQQTEQRGINTKAMDSEIASRVSDQVGKPEFNEKPDAFKNRLTAAKSQYESRMRYGAANRKDGKQLEDMNATERTQLHDAIKFQDKVVGARGTLRQNLVDFTGNKQTDSKDPYSFMPAGKDSKGKQTAATSDIDGQYRIKTANGNTIAVKEAAGGKINFLSSNDPVDADMLKLVQPQIDEYKRQHPKGK